MDYEAFMQLHELLKVGIKEYISSNNNRIHDTTRHNLPSFHVHNGEIRSEICLAVALRYFTCGSYLDITISHGIGKQMSITLFGQLFMQQTDACVYSFNFHQQPWQTKLVDPFLQLWN